MLTRSTGARALFNAGVAAMCEALLHLAGQPFSFVSFAVMWIGVALVTEAGELALDAVKVTFSEARLPAALTLGVTVFSLVMLPIVWFSSTIAATAFVLAGVAVLLIRAIVQWRYGLARPAPDGIDITVAWIFAALIGWYCRDISAALPRLLSSGALPAWLDYYIHAGEIAKFGDSLSSGRGDLSMVGAPRIFYHYGSFMIPAAMLALTQLPALGVATAAFLPIGLLIGCYGTYVLTTQLSDRGTATLATLLVICLPDASTYGLENGFFGFHWLLFTAPGSGYAIGIGSAAAALLVIWLRDGLQRKALVAAIVLTASLVMFRAHMFLLLAPALLVIAMLRMPARLRSMTLRSAGVIVATAILGLSLDDSLRAAWLSYSQVPQFMSTAHEQMGPTAYAGVYSDILQRYGLPAALFAGLLLTLIASLGALVIVYSLALAVLARRRTTEIADLLPAALMGTFALLVLFSPVAFNGDTTEYKQRHFVLLYSICTSYAICLVVRTMPGSVRRTISTFPATAVIALIVTTAGLAIVTRGVDPAAPRFSSGKRYFSVQVDQDLFEAARFVRTRAAPGDVFAMGGPDAQAVLVDDATIFTSLTDMPAFLARSGLQINRGGAASEMARERIARTAEIDRAEGPLRADELLRRSSINWYIVDKGQLPSWDPAGSLALYHHRGIRVYHVDAVSKLPSAVRPGNFAR